MQTEKMVDITKINKPIFYEEGHRYINHNNNKSYTSVTTLLHKFEPPKDWYSIAKKFLNRRTKTQVYSEVSIKYGFTYGEVEAIFNTKGYSAETLIGFWEQKKQKSCIKGTEEHKRRELKTLSMNVHNIRDGVQIPLGIDATYIDNLYSLPDGVYTELLVWNNDLMISGQSDKVIIETINGIRYVEIEDYKTNEVIPDYNYINQRTGAKVINEMLLTPLNEFCNCNYWLYQLQLNIYGWLLVQQGFVFRGGKIIHITDGDREYPLLNLQKVIDKLMKSL